MESETETLPTNPKRIRAFASFFKNYMSVSALVVAALPIPATALGALPTFIDYKSILSTYTSLFCFLTLGFIFYMRHGLARWMFQEEESRSSPAVMQPTSDPTELARREAAIKEELRRDRAVQSARTIRSIFVNVLPFGLLLSTGLLVFEYHARLDDAVLTIARETAEPRSPNMTVACSGIPPASLQRMCIVPTRQEILSRSYLVIPQGSTLLVLYVFMFVTAEAAFILMATREYIQDILKLSDTDLIRGVHRQSDDSPVAPRTARRPIASSASDSSRTVASPASIASSNSS